MSEGPIEGVRVEIISPGDLDEKPSPDPASVQRYITLFDSQSFESRTEYEHYKGVRQHYEHKGQ